MADEQTPGGVGGVGQGSASRGGRRHGPGRGRGRNQRRGHGTGPDGGESGNPANNGTALNSLPAVQETRTDPGGRGRAAGGRGHRSSRGRAGRGRGRGPIQAPLIPGPRRAFGGHLTSAAEERAGPSITGMVGRLSANAPEFVPSQPIAERQTRQPRSQQKPIPKSTAPDLTTRIHQDIDNGNYECGICTDDISRRSKVWAHEGGCWTVAHLSCVKEWFRKADRERENGSSWRCSACNSPIDEPPAGYHCWCGKEQNPRPIAGIAPHSCGQTCSKPREDCPHPCSMQCHAGPCPPCTVMGLPDPCFCGKHVSTKRCIETDYKNGWSCGEPCGDLLPCGQHVCPDQCHGGLCGSCDISIPSICYCGKSQKEMPCETRADIRESFNYGQVDKNLFKPDQPLAVSDSYFEGSFGCGNVCGRPFDCGKHLCARTCHSQDRESPHCPHSPDVVTTCPCGKTALVEMLDRPRNTCEDEVPHCSKNCGKLLACGHRCTKTCHTDSCGPCFEMVQVTCCCGRVAAKSMCLQGRDEDRPMCLRICRARLNCGRHECGERCCQGEKKATERRKLKNTNINDIEPEHICIRICDRLLKCGKHRCTQICHKGQCNSCLEAIFEDISCACGRTILQPPQPCGTGPPECRHDCTRASPCGHSIPHTCHTDDVPCPKCPFLVSKRCRCGKQTMLNQPCWLAEARCGQTCGKKLKCRLHTCKDLCHRPGECEDADIPGTHCHQRCGKTRQCCDHVCTDPCHAPFGCSESKPCQLKAVLLCACQHRKQETKCLASTENPDPIRKTLECDDSCLRLQRNRKLAEALHIDPSTHMDDHIPFSTETLRIYSSNPTWTQAIEKEFRIFAADPQLKRKRFDPMPNHQRAFLHSLGEDFGFETLSEDPDPYRHVSLFKTPKFVGGPMKTLAQAIKIRNAKAKPGTITSALVLDEGAATPVARHEPFNALLLTGPRFGLTTDELDDMLRPELKKFEGDVIFTTSFLPGDEIAIRLTSKATTPWRMTVAENILAAVKPVVAYTAVTTFKAVEAVTLCAVDTVGKIVRKDQVGAGTWNTVVSRAARRGGTTPDGAALARTTAVAGPSSTGRSTSGWGSVGGSGFASMSAVPATMPTRSTGFVSLKLKKKAVKKPKEPVVDNWETAPETIEEGNKDKGENEVVKVGGVHNDADVETEE